MAKVPFREKIMRLNAPFTAAPQELLKLPQRFYGISWLPVKDNVMITDFDRDRRWRTTSMLSLATPEKKQTLFDLSVNDAYGDP